MLIEGLIVRIAADVALAIAASHISALVGIALLGVYMAATQRLFAKLVADCSPPKLRGSAYGPTRKSLNRLRLHWPLQECIKD